MKSRPARTRALLHRVEAHRGGDLIRNCFPSRCSILNPDENVSVNLSAKRIMDVLMDDQCKSHRLYRRHNAFDLIVREEELFDLDDSWLKRLISHKELSTKDKAGIFITLLNWSQFEEANCLAAFNLIVVEVRFAGLLRPAAELMDRDRADGTGFYWIARLLVTTHSQFSIRGMSFVMI